jgi:NAD(P)-dependent dehydrogenase (short-subunit alcohol dehydrogenase family)
MDLDQESAVQSARKIHEELTSDTEEDQLALRDDSRYAARLVRKVQDGAATPAPIKFHEDASYLITGGLGGLGILVAQWMISRGARSLVLVGRKDPTPAANQRIGKITEARGRVVVMRADISVKGDVDRVMEDIRLTLPPLRGIIHAAGVLEDAMLPEQDWTRFQHVLDPKMIGAWHLFTVTRTLSLDFFVHFSSGASLFGSPGQANHAAANAFLDSFAYYLENQGIPAMSINWGAWADVGAAAAHNVAGRLKAKGLGTIPPQEGLAALEYLFANPATQIGVLPVDWPRFIEGRELFPFLADFKPSSDKPARAVRGEVLDELERAPAKKRRALIAAHLEIQVRQVLGLTPSVRLDPQQGFFELGMDSLTSMELKNRLQESLHLNLPNTLTFDYPNTYAVAEYVLLRLFPASVSDAPRVLHATATSESEPPAALEDLSREELGSMIDAMIIDVEKRGMKS